MGPPTAGQAHRVLRDTGVRALSWRWSRNPSDSPQLLEHLEGVSKENITSTRPFPINPLSSGSRRMQRPGSLAPRRCRAPQMRKDISEACPRFPGSSLPPARSPHSASQLSQERPALQRASGLGQIHHSKLPRSRDSQCGILIRPAECRLEAPLLSALRRGEGDPSGPSTGGYGPRQCRGALPSD